MSTENYLKQVAFEDNRHTVYLVITVPDGRILCYNRGAKRLVPRFPSDWQCTLSKQLVRGNSNEKAIKDLLFTSFGWNYIDINDINFILRFGKNKTMLYIYSLLLQDTTYLMPSVGAEIRAMPWEELVHSVENSIIPFSLDTHAVIDVLSAHSKTRREA